MAAFPSTTCQDEGTVFALMVSHAIRLVTAKIHLPFFLTNFRAYQSDHDIKSGENELETTSRGKERMSAKEQKKTVRAEDWFSI